MASDSNAFDLARDEEGAKAVSRMHTFKTHSSYAGALVKMECRARARVAADDAQPA